MSDIEREILDDGEVDVAVLAWIQDEKPISAAEVGMKAVIQCVEKRSAFVFIWNKDGKRTRLLVDMVTANMLKTVYEATKDETKAKMDELVRKSRAHFVALVDRCWKCVK